MPEPLRILVTSVGGDVGQALIKSLRLITTPVKVFGCDADSSSIGGAFVDELFTVPLASDADYLSVMAGICEDNGIDALVPGCEPEIFTLSRAASSGGFSCRAALICQEYSWLKTYGDKLTCFRQLDGKVDLAPYADGSDEVAVSEFIKNVGFPCIVKSRRSWGAKSLRTVADEDELTRVLGQTQVPLVQGYIDDEHGEFTVGVFACDDFTTAIGFKRSLGPIGASWYAENIDQDEDVLNYAYKIAEASGLRGSCNIQVRKSSWGVRLLEINPRFSSLVAARAACGFRDLEWSIYTALGREIQRPRQPFTPVKFRRFLHELIDFGSGYAAIEQWLPRYDRLRNERDSG